MKIRDKIVIQSNFKSKWNIPSTNVIIVNKFKLSIQIQLTEHKLYFLAETHSFHRIDYSSSCYERFLISFIARKTFLQTLFCRFYSLKCFEIFNVQRKNNRILFIWVTIFVHWSLWIIAYYERISILKPKLAIKNYFSNREWLTFDSLFIVFRELPLARQCTKICIIKVMKSRRKLMHQRKISFHFYCFAANPWRRTNKFDENDLGF